MFDTVNIFKGFERKPKEYWWELGFTQVQDRLVFNQPDSPRLTAWDFQGKSYLSAEFSIPRLLYGHNAVLPESQTLALDAVRTGCEYAESIAKLSFDPDMTTIRRLDFARDFQIREYTNPKTISQALFAKELKDFERRSINDSFCFERQTSRGLVKRISIYPKHPEVLSRPNPTPDAIRAAAGKLRFEVRLQGRGLDAIKRSQKGSSPVHLVSAVVSESVISKALESLDLERILVMRTIDFFQYFASVTSDTRDYDLFWFGEAIRRHGVRFYENAEFSYSKRKFYRNKKRCQELGIWQDIVDSSSIQLAMSNTYPKGMDTNQLTS